MTWTGWKRLHLDLPPDLNAPVRSGFALRGAAGDGARAGRGTLHFRNPAVVVPGPGEANARGDVRAGRRICVAASARTKSRGVPVLMYHKVDAPPPSDAVGRSLTLEPAAFEAQVRWLHDCRSSTLTTQGLVDAVSGAGTPQHAVVLTFDDGYEDAYLKVFPILRKYGEHASFYVSADLVGALAISAGRNCARCRRRGWRSAVTAAATSISPPWIGGKTCEIGHCAAALKRWLGTPRTYAYAAGRYDAAAIGVVRANGFERGPHGE